MYFDYATHKDFLPADAQQGQRVEYVADTVEREVLAKYTVTEADGETVKLQGYTEDPDNADPQLRKALVRTIIEITGHRLRHELATQGVDSKSVGKVSTSYGEGFDPLFPAKWKRHLAPFDLREPVWRA
jgi:hypothetical protein